ncbi:MAG TPA: hypothetical protein PK712_03915 [Rectinema sp.]|nr:hypothetical protein [Rectinema sp.]
MGELPYTVTVDHRSLDEPSNPTDLSGGSPGGIGQNSLIGTAQPILEVLPIWLE